MGYRFETSRFVVASIVPASETSPEELANIIKTTKKLHAFDSYCASEPQILGIIEAKTSGKASLSKRIDALKRGSKGFLILRLDDHLVEAEVYSGGAL